MIPFQHHAELFPGDGATRECLEGPFGFMHMRLIHRTTRETFRLLFMETSERENAGFDTKPGNNTLLDIEKLASFLCKEYFAK